MPMGTIITPTPLPFETTYPKHRRHAHEPHLQLNAHLPSKRHNLLTPPNTPRCLQLHHTDTKGNEEHEEDIFITPPATDGQRDIISSNILKPPSNVILEQSPLDIQDTTCPITQHEFNTILTKERTLYHKVRDASHPTTHISFHGQNTSHFHEHCPIGITTANASKEPSKRGRGGRAIDTLSQSPDPQSTNIHAQHLILALYHNKTPSTSKTPPTSSIKPHDHKKNNIEKRKHITHFQSHKPHS
jgi:hypothetical protein